MAVLLRTLQRAANDIRSWPKRPRAVTVITPGQKQSLFFRASVLGLLSLTTVLSGMAWWNSLAPKNEAQVAPKTALIEPAATPTAKIIVKVEHDAQPATQPPLAEKLPLQKNPPLTEEKYQDIVLPAESLNPQDVAPAPDSAPQIAVLAEKITDLPALAPLPVPIKKTNFNLRAKSGVDFTITSGNNESETQLLAEARSKLAAGDNHAALSSYDRVLARDKNNRDALEGKTAALGQSVMPSALSDLEKQVADNPNDAAAQAALAKLLARRGYFERAYGSLNNAIRLAPDNVSYRLDLAILYDQAGYSKDALNLYRQALRAAMKADDPSQLALPLDNVKQRMSYLETVVAVQRN